MTDEFLSQDEVDGLLTGVDPVDRAEGAPLSSTASDLSGVTRPFNLLSQERSAADKSGRHTLELEPYGYRWLRAGDSERPVIPPKAQRG